MDPVKHFLFYLAPSRRARYIVRVIRVIACLSRLLMISALGVLLGAANPQDAASTKDLEGLQGTECLGTRDVCVVGLTAFRGANGKPLSQAHVRMIDGAMQTAMKAALAKDLLTFLLLCKYKLLINVT